jgi:hypothetical protein
VEVALSTPVEEVTSKLLEEPPSAQVRDFQKKKMKEGL